MKKMLLSIVALLIASSIPLTQVNAAPTETMAHFNAFVTTELGQVQLHDYQYMIERALGRPSFSDISSSGDGYAAYSQNKGEANSWIFTYYHNNGLEAILFVPKNKDLSTEFLSQFGTPDEIKINSQGKLVRYGSDQGDHFSFTQRDDRIVLAYLGYAPFLNYFGTMEFKAFADNCVSTSSYRAEILQSAKSLGEGVVAWVKNLF